MTDSVELSCECHDPNCVRHLSFRRIGGGLVADFRDSKGMVSSMVVDPEAEERLREYLGAAAAAPSSPAPEERPPEHPLLQELRKARRLRVRKKTWVKLMAKDLHAVLSHGVTGPLWGMAGVYRRLLLERQNEARSARIRAQKAQDRWNDYQASVREGPKQPAPVRKVPFDFGRPRGVLPEALQCADCGTLLPSSFARCPYCYGVSS